MRSLSAVAWWCRVALVGVVLSTGACSERKPEVKVLPAAPLVEPPPPAPTTGYTPGPVTEGGMIRGKVTLAGAKPTLPPVKCARDPDVCGKPRPNQTLLVDAKNGIKNVIVSLTDIHAGKPPAPAQASLAIKQCAYAPRVQAVPVGTTLVVSNADQVPHDLGGSLNGRNVFNRVVLRSSEKVDLFNPGVVTIGCDTHSGGTSSCETGVVGVMANPYYAVTGDDGSFSLSDVPPGTYTLQVWHEALGNQTRKVTVAASGSAVADFQLTAKAK